MSTTAKKRKTASTLLTCEYCGAEQQIIDDVDNLATNDIVEQWEDDHLNCGRPAGQVAIENLEETVRASSPEYEEDIKGWLDNHPRRPSWGVATIDPDSDESMRQRDVSWWSKSVDVPLLRYDGRLMTAHSGRECFYPAKFRAWLIQGPYNYEPFIASRKWWWTGEKWDNNPCLSMSLTEAEQVIATLQ